MSNNIYKYSFFCARIKIITLNQENNRLIKILARFCEKL